MKKLFLLTFLNLSVLVSSAQKSVVLDAFKKHGIDPSILDPASKEWPQNYKFDYKYTSVTGDKEKITLAKFDPSKPKEEQWTVISVKGKKPSTSDIKSFRKNQSKSPVSAKTDERTYKIEKENAEYLVITYKQDPASLPAEALFMKDCKLYMIINLKTKRLEKLQSLNEKPLKIKIFNAEKLDLVVKFTYNEQEKRYFTVSEDLNLMVKFLGQLAPMETISEYSNYKKI
ncbi:hypothetical protein [Pedobacter metabolipauper]|uniref:DUF4833 domain-containing protein n=1 Tax=Pedobacter metabolipauper TaxID=425513 RepID=A0A4V3D1I0_9SPHI|nr:hypothetical protein [Pedobacter metabolipauper]TDQ11253.1 hypothetical protein ATK78_0371 [Pedobacter metabolipauper]